MVGSSSRDIRLTGTFQVSGGVLAGTVYQAEAAARAGGATVNTNHTGYTGTGFGDGLSAVGAKLTFTVNAPSAGSYRVSMRYANGELATRSISVYVNGTRIRQTLLPGLANWDMWDFKPEYLALNAGSNTIAYQYDSGDTGNINMDAIVVGASPNLARGRTATASSVEGTSFPASNAVDGNGASRWSSAWGDPQWLQVDLGSSYNVNAVVLNWEAAHGKAYQVQVSSDAASWTNLYSTAVGDGGIDALAGLSGIGRYVRVLGTVRATSFGYSLWELEVYGTAATTTPTATATRTATPDGHAHADGHADRHADGTAHRHDREPAVGLQRERGLQRRHDVPVDRRDRRRGLRLLVDAARHVAHLVGDDVQLRRRESAERRAQHDGHAARRPVRDAAAAGHRRQRRPGVADGARELHGRHELDLHADVLELAERVAERRRASRSR